MIENRIIGLSVLVSHIFCLNFMVNTGYTSIPEVNEISCFILLSFISMISVLFAKGIKFCIYLFIGAWYSLKILDF